MKQRRSNRFRCAHFVEALEARCMLTTWALDAIDAPEVWSHGYRGQGVTVAVIDSGIDIHADLLPNVWVNTAEKINGRDDDGNGYIDDLNGWNFVDDNNNPTGKHSHGTHVAGTIAAELNDFGTTGVAHEAKIMPLRVFNEAGVGNTSDIADAVRYAVRNGADIINLSIGGTATRSLKLALEYAARENVLVVAASGNDGAAEPSFPAIQSAHWSHVISVGGHDQQFEVIDSSNQVGSSKAVQVDAPGVSILSTVTKNEFAKKGGTSAAAAHVAGIAALMISANHNLTAAELRNAIIASASRKVVGSDSVGAVNALRAVALVSGGFTGTSLGIASEADFNNNGAVDFTDFMTLARNFGNTNVDHRTGDTDGDGTVGFTDFLILAKNFGDEVPLYASREYADLQSAIAQSPAHVVDSATTDSTTTSNSSTKSQRPTASTTSSSTTASSSKSSSENNAGNTGQGDANVGSAATSAASLLQSLLTLRGREPVPVVETPIVETPIVPPEAPSVSTPAVITSPPAASLPPSTAIKSPEPELEPEIVEEQEEDPPVIPTEPKSPAILEPSTDAPTKQSDSQVMVIEPEVIDAVLPDVVEEATVWSASNLMLSLFSSRQA